MKVKIDYEGPAPFVFAGAALGGGLGATAGYLKGGPLGAIAGGVFGVVIGALMGTFVQQLVKELERFLEALVLIGHGTERSNVKKSAEVEKVESQRRAF